MPTPPEISARVIRDAGLTLSPAEGALIADVQGVPHAWAEVTAALYSSKMLERSLDKHAQALKQAADASDKYAESLTRATWRLYYATVVLAVVATASIVATIGAAFIARGGH